MAFELGEAFQFDSSEEGLMVGGIYYPMQVSHMKSCRAFWLDLPPALELQPAQLLDDDFSLNFVGSGGSQYL